MAEATLALSAEQNIVFHVPAATVLRGWTLSKQGQREDGMDQMHQGLTAIQANGSTVFRPLFLALLADIYGKAGQVDKGLSLIAEARTLTDQNVQRYAHAELYRLEGELRLQLITPDISQAGTC